jgi:hypothetical protein
VWTIWRVLNAPRGVTPPNRTSERRARGPLLSRPPQLVLASDITHVTLAKGAALEALNVIDDHSRLSASGPERSLTARTRHVVRTLHRPAANRGLQPPSRPR